MSGRAVTALNQPNAINQIFLLIVCGRSEITSMNPLERLALFCDVAAYLERCPSNGDSAAHASLLRVLPIVPGNEIAPGCHRSRSFRRSELPIKRKCFVNH